MILVKDYLGELFLIDGPGKFVIDERGTPGEQISQGMKQRSLTHCLLFKSLQGDSSQEIVLYFADSNFGQDARKSECESQRNKIINGFQDKIKYFDFSES